MADLSSLPTDVHVHIQPWEMMRPGALETIRRGRGDHALVERLMRDPGALAGHLDEVGLGRVGVINYVAPDVMGFTPEVNAWAARYKRVAGPRMIAFGGIHPPACHDVGGEMRVLLEEHRIQALKLHPPHQELDPAGYRSGSCPELATVYGALEEAGVPLMIHTGTSIFPGARSRFGACLPLDDVAVDFPRLTIIMAHGGRPLWMDEAFFLLRRHPNVHMDVSGIPPKRLLDYFPRLEEVSHKVLFGSDWPSPGVRDLSSNLETVRGLPLSDEAKDRILRANALAMFPLEG